jgi:hypothetical protein
MADAIRCAAYRPRIGGTVTRKKDKGRRSSAAARQNLPVGPFIHEAADRVGPLAHDAADRIGPVAHDAGDRVGPFAHDAADFVGPLAVQAADRVAPLAQSAVDTVQPYARDAANRIQPYAQQAIDRIEPLASQAADRVGPYATTAKRRGAEAAALVVEKLGPILDEAAGKIGPAVDDTRERLRSEVLPAVSERLHDIAETAVKAAEQSKELVVVVEEPKKRRWPKRLAVVAGVIAVGSVAYVVAKKVLGGPEEDDWASRPATPYASTTITEPKPTTAPPATDKAASASTAPEPEDEPQPAHAAEDEAGQESKYGEGSYVGTEPPEGFAIKGNERSMKYHVPDSSGYDRTNAEVWFNSEQAAEAAGFTRAQR